jgi:hypothetical protein
MNRFIYRRGISDTIRSMKSLYPKCINCINFKKDKQTCKKSIITENYINYDSQNELALHVRNDNKKCGESGNWFQLGENQLKEVGKGLFSTFCVLSAVSGVTCFATDASRITLLPLALNVFSLFVYLDHIVGSQDKIDNEKRRIQQYNHLYNK